MIAAYARWVIRFRWWIIVGGLAATAVAGSGAQYLRFNNDYRVFFSEQNPQLLAFDALQNTYSTNDNVLFLIVPKDGEVFTRETLASVERLTKAAWQLPYVKRVDSITNFQFSRARGDELVVSDLIENAPALSAEQIAQARAVALAEPLLPHRLISPQAHVTAVNATIVVPGKTLDEVPEVMAHARKLVAEARAQNANIDVVMTGGVVIDNAFGEHARKDMMTLTPIMYGLIILVTFALLRSVSATFATVAVIALAATTAMGLSGWIGIELTSPSVGAPTVILTLAVAHSIHVLITILQGLRGGKTKEEAIAEGLKLNMYPIFLATLTDVIGFLSMNTSEVPPFRDLGNIITLGVIAAYLGAIAFLPALMAVLPVRVRQTPREQTPFMDTIANFVIRRRMPLLLGMSALVLALVVQIPRNELNDEFVKYFSEDTQFRQEADLVAANLSGIDQIEYSLRAAGPGGVADPAYLRKLDEFANWYRTQPGVQHVNSVVDIMKRLNKNMHGDDAAYYRIPDGRELAAQYLLLYEMSLPFGLDLTDQINVDKSATRFSVTLKNSSTKEILATEANAQAWLAANAPEYMRASGTGSSMMFAHIGDRNIRSMISGNAIALLLISGVLVLALRNLKLGLLSLVPNLVPAAMAFGLWGLFVGQVGLALSVVAVMTYGIVVDDTIHSMTKYLHARRTLLLDTADAVRYVFSTVGTAAWAMTAILVAGFGVLTFSDFELNSSLGIMTALTIALALMADFFLLPPLLMAFDRKRYEKSDNTQPAAHPGRV